MARQTTQVPKSKKDSYLEGFRTKHPDWQDDDEEGFYGALLADAADAAEKMQGYADREQQVTDALSGSAMNAALFMDAMDGTPIPLALLNRFPDEIREWLNDPSNSEALEKTFNEHAQRIDENKKLQEEKEKNNEESNAMLDGLVDSGEYTEEQINEALTYLGKIAVGLMADHVEKEWIDFAMRAMNHDTDVDAARREGEVKGRNANITAQRRDAQRGAGNHASLGGSNANSQPLTSRETRDALGANGRRDMWGGMKVNKLT